MVTQNVLRLHRCNVTMGWCFRTGTWQTCRGSENRIFPLKTTLLLTAKGSSGKPHPFSTPSLHCFTHMDTDLQLLRRKGRTVPDLLWCSHIKGVHRAVQGQATLTGLAQYICCLNMHFVTLDKLGKLFPKIKSYAWT